MQFSRIVLVAQNILFQYIKVVQTEFGKIITDWENKAIHHLSGLFDTLWKTTFITFINNEV